MISEITAWLFAVLGVNPLYAEVRERVETANLTVEAAQQSQQCLAIHGPRLLQQAEKDPAWAVGTAVGIVTGWSSPAQLLEIDSANCSILTGLLANDAGENVEG